MKKDVLKIFFTFSFVARLRNKLFSPLPLVLRTIKFYFDLHFNVESKVKLHHKIIS